MNGEVNQFGNIVSGLVHVRVHDWNVSTIGSISQLAYSINYFRIFHYTAETTQVDVHVFCNLYIFFTTEHKTTLYCILLLMLNVIVNR